MLARLPRPPAAMLAGMSRISVFNFAVISERPTVGTALTNKWDRYSPHEESAAPAQPPRPTWPNAEM